MKTASLPTLALTRRPGEEVVIGDPADPLGVVRVVQVSGDRVRLAFSFPVELAVNRRELADEKAAACVASDGEACTVSVGELATEAVPQ